MDRMSSDVVLDFQHIRTVGQGFVDEVFRVFQQKHPEIKIESVNTSEDIRFMIERSLPGPAGHPGKKFLYKH